MLTPLYFFCCLCTTLLYLFLYILAHFFCTSYYRWMLNGRTAPADRPATSMGISSRNGRRGGGRNGRSGTTSRPSTASNSTKSSRPESRREAEHVENELDRFDKSLQEQKKMKLKANMFRLRSGASKKARNIKRRKAMHAFG